MAIIQDKLDSIDANDAYTKEEKSLLKMSIRSEALYSVLHPLVGSALQFTKRGNSYSVRLDSVFVQGDGWLVVSGEINKNGQVVPINWPLMFRNNPITDENGTENLIQAARDMLADVVG